MDFATQPKSSVLAELAAASGAASKEWDKALETYLARHYPDMPFFEQAGQAFKKTATARELEAKVIEARRKHRAALDVAEFINLGQVFHMSELSEAARERVYELAAKNATKNGPEPLKWPERDELLAFIRSNPRPRTYAEAAEARERAYANVDATVDRVLKERGRDPTKWTENDIQEVAMAQARVVAFKKLVQRASNLDPIWNTRTV